MRRTSPIRANIHVDFAFLSFSSSPNDFVYWIPDQTIAPTARSAPREIAHVATFTTRTRIQLLSAPSRDGSIPIVPFSFAQPIRNPAAFSESRLQRAKLAIGRVKITKERLRRNEKNIFFMCIKVKGVRP